MLKEGGEVQLGERHRVFLDVDVESKLRRNWLFYRPPWELWDDTLPLVEFEVKRLRDIFPKLGKARIFRSSGRGWLVKISANLEWKELEAILCESKAEHHGHRWFSILCKDDTLRVSEKPPIARDYYAYIRKVVDGKLQKVPIRLRKRLRDGVHKPYLVKII